MLEIARFSVKKNGCVGGKTNVEPGQTVIYNDNGCIDIKGRENQKATEDKYLAVSISISRDDIEAAKKSEILEEG
jgi:hypothetical protein